MPKVSIQYFAILREQRGLPQETIVTVATTAAGLYDTLRAQHGFTLSGERVRAAVNGSFVEPHRALNDGDEVVFIPPVAGG